MLANDGHVHVLSVVDVSTEDGYRVRLLTELVIDDFSLWRLLARTSTYL